MATNNLLDSPAWKQFQQEASKRNQDPFDLVTRYINECLEIWEDESVDEEISKQARQSGYAERDAVTLVRQYRQENRN